MDARERVEAALRLEEPDLVPIHPHISRWTAKLIGVTVREYYRSPELMVRGQKAAYELLGHEIVYIGSNLTAEAEALGCQIEYPEWDAPKVRQPILSSLEKLDDVRVPEPSSSPPLRVVLEALRIAEGEFKPKHLMVCGDVCGPFTLAGYLRGVNTLMIEVLRKPENVEAVLKLATETILAYLEEQVKAGTDLILMNDPLASGDMISPKHYERLVVPYQKTIVQHAKKLGCHPMLHICGNTADRLDLMASTGVEAISIEAKVDLAYAKEKVGRKVCIAGNVDPINVLMNGSPETVREETRRAIEKASKGGGFILMPGCGVPYGAPKENLKAMVEAARKYGVYKR